MDGHSFNLVRNPWIPVEDSSGELREVSLTELFASAAELRRIMDPSPLVTAAIYRLLFAIATRAFAPASEEEWEEIWDEGRLSEETGQYLQGFVDRFDLFSTEAPFYQVKDMPENCRLFPWTKLAAELPPNFARLLFDHTSTVDPPAVAPAAVARVLIAALAFTVGAGRSCLGYTSNAPLTAAVVVIPEGRNLKETILANIQSGSGPSDYPTWERRPITARDVEGQAGEAWGGPVSRLTWLSRSVEIIPETSDGSVKWIRFAMGFKTPAIDGDRDPWVMYRVTRTGDRIPRKLDLDRMVWRDFHGMLVGGGDGQSDTVQALTRLASLEDADRRPPDHWTVLVAGMHADKASIKAWRQERWRVPQGVVADNVRRHNLRAAIEEAEQFGERVRRAAWITAAKLLEDRDNPARSDITQLANSFPAGTTYWGALEGRFQAFLMGLGGDVDEARAVWRRDIQGAIRAAARATRAALGRNPASLRAWAVAGRAFDRLVYRLEAPGAEEERTIGTEEVSNA